jgi:hypothetical protein
MPACARPVGYVPRPTQEGDTAVLVRRHPRPTHAKDPLANHRPDDSAGLKDAGCRPEDEPVAEDASLHQH